MTTPACYLHDSSYNDKFLLDFHFCQWISIKFWYFLDVIIVLPLTTLFKYFNSCYMNRSQKGPFIFFLNKDILFMRLLCSNHKTINQNEHYQPINTNEMRSYWYVFKDTFSITLNAPKLCLLNTSINLVQLLVSLVLHIFLVTQNKKLWADWVNDCNSQPTYLSWSIMRTFYSTKTSFKHLTNIWLWTSADET